MQLEQERSSFVLQINELHQNLTNTILHVSQRTKQKQNKSFMSHLLSS